MVCPRIDIFDGGESQDWSPIVPNNFERSEDRAMPSSGDYLYEDPAALAKVLDGPETDDALRAEYAAYIAPHRPEIRTNPRPDETEKKIEWKTNLVEAYKQALKDGKPLVVEFSADWCAFCRSMDNFILPRPEVQKMAGSAVFAKVDPDTDKDAAAMVESFKINSYPTFLVLDCSAQALKERGRIVGYQDADEFVRLLKLLVPAPSQRDKKPEVTAEPQPLVA